jgi:hypothetical protein
MIHYRVEVLCHRLVENEVHFSHPWCCIISFFKCPFFLKSRCVNRFYQLSMWSSICVILCLPCRYIRLGFMLQTPPFLWPWVVLSAATEFMKILFMSVYLFVVFGKAVYYPACFLLQDFCRPYLCCLWENLKFPTKVWLRNHKRKQ